MRLMLILPLLALVACSSASPAYERGAYRPAPAPTRPGAGLPVPGQPRPPLVQPNPKPTRALPPTDEPGLWAASEPHTAPAPYADEDLAPLRGKPVPWVSVFHVEIPLPPDTKDAAEASPAVWCAAQTRYEIEDAFMGPRVVILTPPERACCIALAMDVCSRWLYDDLRTRRNSAAGFGGRVPAGLHEKIAATERFKRAAFDFHVRSCPLRKNTSAATTQCMDDLFANIRRKYGAGRLEH